MKRAMIVFALAAVLVVALGGTALAKGASPANRSSSYLAKGESYIKWTDAQAKMAATGASAEATASVHGNYLTTTVKCQVCHSAHKASSTGDTLLQATAAQACVPCHLGATATSSLKVSAGNRHGGTTQCTNGYCHAVAPHGAGDISKYATLKTAMLTQNADSLLDAAIASAATTGTVNGNIYATGTTTPIATIAVRNPGVTAALLNDVSTPAAIAVGRAVGTGYVCANGGCHMNGQFNSLTEDATFGVWGADLIVDVAAPATGYSTTLPDGTPYVIPNGTYSSTAVVNVAGVDYNVWDLYHMRKSAIKGHTLATVADLAVRNVAFANVGQCSSCHDSIDYRISATAKQFPHGNTVVNPDGTIPATGNVSNAWFLLKPYVGGTATSTNKTTLVSGMDGACLKCHRSSDTAGVGFDF